ncbi:hypothetical protein EYR36_003613 [Pleurotus pulmonarius]|nr:hypothetical protein EYR36_003613 [Pleurotus pulmonarius]
MSSALGNLFSRRATSVIKLDRPPLFSKAPPWWARWTYALIACDLFVTASAVEFTWNNWTQLTDDLKTISQKSKEGTVAVQQPSNDSYVPRPSWQRAGLCIAHLGVGIGIAVALMVTQSRYVRTFTLSPALLRAKTGKNPIQTPPQDRQVLISCANNLKNNGQSFPLASCSVGEGRDASEMILRVDGERGHWFLSLENSLINGKKASVMDAQRAILEEWGTARRTGTWTPLAAADRRWTPQLGFKILSSPCTLTVLFLILIVAIFSIARKTIMALRNTKWFLEFRTFVVDDELFLIPTAYFERHSSVISKLINSSEGQEPIRLEGVTKVEFSNFLDIHSDISAGHVVFFLKKEHWLSALKLANMWQIWPLRAAIIQKLKTKIVMDDAVQRVVMGLQYSIEEWVLRGCEELVDSYEALTPGEAEQLGLQLTLEICNLREERFRNKIFQLNVQLCAALDTELKDIREANHWIPAASKQFTSIFGSLSGPLPATSRTPPLGPWTNRPLVRDQVGTNFAKHCRVAHTKDFIQRMFHVPGDIINKVFASLQASGIYDGKRWKDFPPDKARVEDKALYAPFIQATNAIWESLEGAKNDLFGVAGWVDYHTQAPKPSDLDSVSVRLECLLAHNASKFKRLATASKADFLFRAPIDLHSLLSQLPQPQTPKNLRADAANSSRTSAHGEHPTAAMQQPTTTGTASFQVNEEVYQTAYKVFGNLSSDKRPVVVLHGGPGVPHNYVLALSDLYHKFQVPVVFYDQLGCGMSSHLPEKPKDFWKIELFMDELDNLLAHLGIEANFDLLGQSWGGMLASTYAALRRPGGLKHLVITNSPASMALWEKSAAILLDGLPDEVKEGLLRLEKEGKYEAKEYQDGMSVFYKKHVCRLDPWPEEVLEAFKLLDEDPTVYHTMNGPSEFTIVGSIKSWSIIDDLHHIACPTLVINGAYDEAQDLCVNPFFERIHQVKWVQFANSSHMPFIEERVRYIEVVAVFLAT